MAMYDDGYSRGLNWATHAAADSELRNLQALRAGKSEEEWRNWFAGPQAGQTASPPAFKRFIPVMRPESDGQPTDVAAFWRSAVAFDANLPQRVVQDPTFVHGFADGALEAWKEAGGAGERGSEIPDEEWLDNENGPSTANDT
jgi:hypothetical protein